MLLLDFDSGYSQELVTTGIVVGLTILACFGLLGWLYHQESSSSNESATPVLGITIVDSPSGTSSPKQAVEEDTVSTRNNLPSNNQTVTLPTPTQTPPLLNQSSPSPSPITSSPSPGPRTPYGVDQVFDYPDYTISFANPRLEGRTQSTFKVDVILRNHLISNGIDNTIFGVISREDEIITTRAPLSLSTITRLLPDQQASFSASISLPESTQLDQLIFSPASTAPATTVNLGPS